MREIIWDSTEFKKSKIWKSDSVVNLLAAASFTVYSLLDPTPIMAEDKPKCGNYIKNKWDYAKNKCVEVSPEFTFLWDQKIDIDFFDNNKIIWNNGNIKFIDNWYPVNILDWAMAKEAVFWEEVEKIFKDKNWKLVIENKKWEKKYYTIEKVKNGMTNLKEYFKVEFSVDWVNFQSLDKMDKKIKTLDLWWKVWQAIKIDNENGEIYNLSYNWTIINLGGSLDSNTDNVKLTKEWFLIITDKSINWKKWNEISFELQKDNKWNISVKKIYQYK